MVHVRAHCVLPCLESGHGAGIKWPFESTRTPRRDAQNVQAHSKPCLALARVQSDSWPLGVCANRARSLGLCNPLAQTRMDGCGEYLMIGCTSFPPPPPAGIGVTPLGNFNPWAGLYAAVHIVLGAFVLLNLIVGSVINNYNRVKALNNGVTLFTTPEQQEWKETQRIIFNLKPMARKRGPDNPFRQWCFKIVEHTNFELAITVVIVMNVITMMTRTHNQTDCMTTAIYWFNVFFLAVFIVEAVMKLVGLGPRWYFTDTWNMFDFVVVILSIVMMGLDTADGDWTCDPTYESGDFNVSKPRLPFFAPEITRDTPAK